MKIYLNCDMGESIRRYHPGCDLCLHDDHLHATETPAKVLELPQNRHIKIRISEER